MTGLLSINNSSRESDSLDILKNPYLLRYLQIFFLAIIGVIIILGIGSLSDSNPVHALPEYSTHTGQACGTCHVNPGGGGPRTLRGLLWAAQGRPDVVPMLENVLIAPGVEDGLELYDIACAGCHGFQAEGLFGIGLADTGIPKAAIRTFVWDGLVPLGMPAFEG